MSASPPERAVTDERWLILRARRAGPFIRDGKRIEDGEWVVFTMPDGAAYHLRRREEDAFRRVIQQHGL